MKKNKKTVVLNRDEAKLEKEIESGEWAKAPDQNAQFEKLRSGARETLNKNRKINIRLTDWDYLNLKARAAQEGLPYQTLVSSIIHKYLTKQLS